MNRYQCLVFDWDGTLCDSHANIIHALRSAANECQLASFDERLARNSIGLDLQSMVLRLYPELEVARLIQLTDSYRYHYSKVATHESLFLGVKEFLLDLKAQHYFLAIATGKSHFGLVQALQRNELMPIFDTTQTADRNHSKPHPQMLLDIMAFTQVPAQQTLMIGDSQLDILFAHNAEVDAIGVSQFPSDTENLLDAGAMHVVPEVTQILQYL